eukprot:1841035-Rhodomonas_salina.1
MAEMYNSEHNLKYVCVTGMNTDSLKAIHHDQVHTQVGWVYKLLAKRHAPADLLAMHEPGPVESKNSVALLNVFCQRCSTSHSGWQGCVGVLGGWAGWEGSILVGRNQAGWKVGGGQGGRCGWCFESGLKVV